MVTHPRAAVCPNRLQPLNQPKPVKVQEDMSGDPVAITYKGRRIAVEGVKDRWRIDDEWWRKAISRLYYQVVLKDGRILTLFRDLLDGGWFMQSTAIPESHQGDLRVFIGHSAKRDDFNVRRTALP